MFVMIRKKKLYQWLALLGAVCLAVGVGKNRTQEDMITAVSAEGSRAGYLAIVIDDFGYRGEGTEEMLQLSIPFTAAVMPFSTYTQQDGEAIKKAKKEAIVHLPMESLTGPASWVGEKAVRTQMEDGAIQELVKDAIAAVPGAVGINNHMGSKIMEDKRAMSDVLDVAKQYGLLFVDSKTTPNSQAEALSKEKGVTYLERSVFLDSTDDIMTVKNNLKKAADLAKKTGFALAIGHVGPEGGKITAKALQDMAPELQKEGIVFVTVKQLAEILYQQNEGGL